MKFEIVSARFLGFGNLTFQNYGDKLQKVVPTRFYKDVNRGGEFIIEIEVNTLEELRDIAKAVGYNLIFPERDNGTIWIYDDYME